MLTYRMMMILEVVGKRNADGTAVDLDQIIERVDYKVTKCSIQFTMRAMVEKGLVVKCERESRRGRRRVLYETTGFGQDMYRTLTPAV